MIFEIEEKKKELYVQGDVEALNIKVLAFIDNKGVLIKGS